MKYNRREFIQQSILGVSAVNYSILSNRFYDDERTKNNREIITRPLGKTGIDLPVISMGVMNTLDSSLIEKSYNIGVRHFDTAAYYMQGQNERTLGETFKKMKVRKEVVISTKIPVFSLPVIIDSLKKKDTKKLKAEFIKHTEESLKRLQTDYVDILYIHAVNEVIHINIPGFMEALQTLKSQGKIRSIGFSTHGNMAELIKNNVETKFYDVILTSFNYAMSNNQEYINILQKAAESGIGLIAMKTQCMQPWYKDGIEEEQNKKFYEGKIHHTALLKYVMHNKSFTTAVPGYTNFDQMNEDFSVAYNIDYNEDEIRFLKDRNVILSMKSVCQQCSHCVATCKYKVDIPKLIRAHSYATCYPNIEQARQTLSEIPEARNINNCTLCKECTAVCANKVNISKRIKELKLILDIQGHC